MVSRTYTGSFCGPQLGPKGCAMNTGSPEIWFMDCDADTDASWHAPVCRRDSSEYFVGDYSTSYDDAKNYCADRGASLATIYSSTENELARQACGDSSCWIGLEEVGGDATTVWPTWRWRWPDGSEVTYACNIAPVGSRQLVMSDFNPDGAELRFRAQDVNDGNSPEGWSLYDFEGHVVALLTLGDSDQHTTHVCLNSVVSDNMDAGYPCLELLGPDTHARLAPTDWVTVVFSASADAPAVSIYINGVVAATSTQTGSTYHAESGNSLDAPLQLYFTSGEWIHELQVDWASEECWHTDCGGECAVHGLGPEYAKARPDGTPCESGCECCRADGGCGECAGDHVCEFPYGGDWGACTSCEAKFAGDDGLIEHCRNEAGAGFDWDGTLYDNSCRFGHDDDSACDGIHLEAGVGEVCNWAHGETHGCPVVNTQLWDSELWSCDDLCGRAGGWCERAAHMSNNHCGSDVAWEYELACDQGIRDIRTWGGEPSHTLCWCWTAHTYHWWHYYDEADDDDDGLGGGSELVMSGGLVAIGLTFTGITIATIANLVQEQCALGPTIVYEGHRETEAGTTGPYLIGPNLCTIGAHTYASKNTVRDASPRKVCRKFCEAASEKGKLALKHVQGLTCYCKRG